MESTEDRASPDVPLDPVQDGQDRLLSFAPRRSVGIAGAAPVVCKGDGVCADGEAEEEEPRRPFDVAASDYHDGNDLLCKKLYGDREKPADWSRKAHSCNHLNLKYKDHAFL